MNEGPQQPGDHQGGIPENHELRGIGRKPRAFTRDIVIYLASESMAMAGGIGQSLALLWIIYELTGSATTMGATFAVSTLPYLVTLPFMGTLVDTVNRKHLLIFINSLKVLLAISLFALSVSDLISTTFIVAYFLLASLLFALKSTLKGAVIVGLAEKEALPKVNSVASAVFSGVGIGSPMIAAFLIGRDLVNLCFLFNGVASMAACVLVVPIRLRQTHLQEKGDKSVLAKILAGVRYLRERRAVLLLVGIFALVNFFLTADMMLVRILIEERSIQDGFLGLYEAAQATGAVVIGPAIGLSVLRRYLGSASHPTIYFGCIVVLGAGVSILGITDSVPLLLVSPLISGAAGALLNITFFSHMQGSIPKSLYGRVMSVAFLVSEGLKPGGYAFFGLLADLMQIRTVFLVIAAGVGGASILVLFLGLLEEQDSAPNVARAAAEDAGGVRQQ